MVEVERKKKSEVKWKSKVKRNAKRKKRKSESESVFKSDGRVILDQVVTLKEVSLSLCYPFLCEPRT